MTPSLESSDKKLPTPIEKPSTKIKTIPVRKMVPRGIPAIAIPDNNPTVETRLSSTPKI